MDRDENQADDVTNETPEDEAPETASPIEESEAPAAAKKSDTPASETEEDASATRASDEDEDEELEDADSAPEPEADEEPVAVVVRQRTVPRYGSFIGAGAILGALVALVLFVALPSDGGSSPVTALLYLVIVLAPLTALLGGLLAVIFEKRSK